MNIINVIALEGKVKKSDYSSDMFYKTYYICMFYNDNGYNTKESFALELCALKKDNENLGFSLVKIIRDKSESLFNNHYDRVYSLFKKACQGYSNKMQSLSVYFNNDDDFIRSLFAAKKWIIRKDNDFYNYDDFDKEISSYLKNIELKKETVKWLLYQSL